MSEPRKQISARMRYEVIRRDGFKCKYCGATADDAQLTVDHVVPVALGGADDPSNLVTACQPCNAGKSTTGPVESVVEEVDDRAVRWADAIKRAAEIQAKQRDSRDVYVAEFERAWNDWAYADGEHITRPTNWRQSVTNWHDAGLEIDALVALVDDVLPAKIPDHRMWRYFCGAVWTTLRKRQEIAKQLLAGDEASSW